MRSLALLASAAQSLRQSPLRTGLSVLGLVIGVAALVGILSLIDGLERYARDQVETTTSVQTVTVTPRQREEVDGVSVARDEVVRFGRDDARALGVSLGEQAAVALVQQRAAVVTRDTVRTALSLIATDATASRWSEVEVREGRMFGPADSAVVVVSASLAARLASGGPPVLGQRVRVGGVEAEVVGVVEGEADGPQTGFGPYRTFAELDGSAPTVAVHVERAEDVALVVGQVEAWLAARFESGRAAFDVASYASRAEQFRQGILLFKLVMGLITGISVLVGGVGVMNVLLMTVTERTREIGVRKAAGARRRDVAAQFLAEAVAVSSAGSLLGLAAGLAGVFAVAPVLRSLTDVPFQAAVTWGTLVVVGGVAVAVGVVFGTYPALRAARLSPVEAMRHE